MIQLFKETILYVIGTLIHNAPVLALGILVAAAITVYVDPEKMRTAIMKKSYASIGGSVAFGAFTPFCACGTMAVIVAMMTTALPWGPIMAFLTSSPLMSPDEFILYSGIISVKFAVALTVSSVVIGLGSGYITHFIEKKTHYLDGQARFADVQKSACCGSKKEEKVVAQTEACSCAESTRSTDSCSCDGNTVRTEVCACDGNTAKVMNSAEPCGCENQNQVAVSAGPFSREKLTKLAKVFFEIGVKQVLVYFALFAAIGFMINKFVPAELIMKYMGSGNRFAVPLMALIGLPLYVNGSSAIPIINALTAGGASQGALLAFMITGPGTSAGVIAGMFTIMKRKAIALYIAYLLVFGILLGYLYDFLLSLGL